MEEWKVIWAKEKARKAIYTSTTTLKNEVIISNGWCGMDDEEANKKWRIHVTPFMIKFDEVHKNEEDGCHVQLVTIQLPIDQLKIEEKQP